MILATSVAPTPIPGTSQPVPYPFNWTHKALVHAELTNVKGPGAPKSYEGNFKNDYVPSLLKATTLTAAVTEASQMVAKGLAWSLEHDSVAVLQATTGAYYAADLRNDGFWKRGAGRPLSLEPVRRENEEHILTTVQRVSPLDPAVQAVVGQSTWANFTTQQINPKLGAR